VALIVAGLMLATFGARWFRRPRPAL
jgi:hypothetical protein